MSSATVQPGQTLFDIAVQHAGSVEAVFELAALNGLAVTAALTPGDVLTLPEVVDKRVRRIMLAYVPASEGAAAANTADFRPVRLLAAQRDNRITVRPRQSLFDIAVQYGGGMQSVFELARLNDLEVTAELTAGQLLVAPVAVSATVVTFFLEGGYFPASVDPGLLEGIDYWRIEYEFEVQ